MQDWLQQFINPSFMPHGHCYLWRSDILWTHVISDAAIGIAYFLIPLVLGVIIYKRQDALPHKDIFALFIAFIFFCGTTHFVQIYVTWYPLYEYQGWIKALTAFTSVLTVIVLAPKLPQLIRLSGVEEENNRNLKELALLKSQNEQMNSVYSATLDREEKIMTMKKEVNELLAELGKEQRYEL